jgi:hypothetical protein
MEADASGVKFECGDDERHYYTRTRMKFDYQKHFKEDSAAIEKEIAHPASQWTDQEIDMPYKSRRCAKKYALRKKCLQLTPKEFVEGA